MYIPIAVGIVRLVQLWKYCTPGLGKILLFKRLLCFDCTSITTGTTYIPAIARQMAWAEFPPINHV